LSAAKKKPNDGRRQSGPEPPSHRPHGHGAIGGVTLLALSPDLPIFVDERLLRLDYVILGGR
jgi:hypothetical protein